MRGPLNRGPLEIFMTTTIVITTSIITAIMITTSIMIFMILSTDIIITSSTNEGSATGSRATSW